MGHENATPRPWHYSHGLRRILGALDDYCCHPQVAEGISKRISDKDPRAIQFEHDAALIVEAVNAYDTLRAENDRLRFARRDLAEELLALLTQLSEADSVTDYAREERIADLRAALALSEVQP